MATEGNGSKSSEEKIGTRKRMNPLARFFKAWGTLLTLALTLLSLIIGIITFEMQQAANQAQVLDQQRQATLDGYLDDMSNLLLMSSLRITKQGSEVQVLAQARTYEAVRNLDGARKGTLVRFLWEAGLLNGSQSIISLNRADLSSTDLSGTNVSGTNVSGISSCGSITENCAAAQNDVNLSGAILSGANLSDATLGGAILSGADLSGADLSNTDLIAADLIGADLSKATNLNAAILNGAEYNTKTAREGTLILGPTQWPQGFDPQAAGVICVDC